MKKLESDVRVVGGIQTSTKQPLPGGAAYIPNPMLNGNWVDIAGDRYVPVYMLRQTSGIPDSMVKQGDGDGTSGNENHASGMALHSLGTKPALPKIRSYVEIYQSFLLLPAILIKNQKSFG